MFKQGSKDSDQFQRFNGTYDDRIYFRVKGLKNDANWTPEEIRNQYLAKKPPGTLVYQKTKYDFLVLSGLRGQTIFYTRVAVSLDNTIICVLDINYPRAFKLQLDPVITRMSRSFGAK